MACILFVLIRCAEIGIDPRIYLTLAILSATRVFLLSLSLMSANSHRSARQHAITTTWSPQYVKVRRSSCTGLNLCIIKLFPAVSITDHGMPGHPLCADIRHFQTISNCCLHSWVRVPCMHRWRGHLHDLCSSAEQQDWPLYLWKPTRTQR